MVQPNVIVERAGILLRIRYALYVIFDPYFAVVTRPSRHVPDSFRNWATTTSLRAPSYSLFTNSATRRCVMWATYSVGRLPVARIADSTHLAGHSVCVCMCVSCCLYAHSWGTHPIYTDYLVTQAFRHWPRLGRVPLPGGLCSARYLSPSWGHWVVLRTDLDYLIRSPATVLRR
jgi:hypothetical protein